MYMIYTVIVTTTWPKRMQVSKLEGELDDNKAKLSGTEEELKESRDHVVSLRAELKDNKNQTAVLKADLEDAWGKVSTLETEMEAARAQVIYYLCLFTYDLSCIMYAYVYLYVYACVCIYVTLINRNVEESAQARDSGGNSPRAFHCYSCVRRLWL